MDNPTTKLSGVIDQCETFGKVTVLNVVCTLKGKDGDKQMTFPVKYFGDRAAKFAELNPRGRTLEVTCYVTSKEFNGKHYPELLGGNYVLGDPVAQPTPQAEAEDPLPF